MNWRSILPYIIMMMIVPIAGEFQFYPLNLDFRLSFATPVLLLTLFYFKTIHAPLASTLVGMSVVVIRITLGLLTGDDFQDLFFLHSPVFAYYLIYGWLFHLVPFKNYMKKPHYVGLFAWALEVGASMGELIARNLTTGFVVSTEVLSTIFIVAIMRSTFVMGIFMLVLYYDLIIREEQQRKKNEANLAVISDLFVEMTQLKKSIKEAEEITAHAFLMSKQLKKQGEHQLSRNLLNMSGKIHENKKNFLRIYASLSNLIEKQDYKELLPVSEIFKLVIKMNRSYAEYLKKDITFVKVTSCPQVQFHSYFLLSILNNLISNAIESIHEKGIVTMSIEQRKTDGYLVFCVKDNGPGIKEQDRSVIFRAGFTTKFDEQGISSNGIGLSYIKQIIEEHDGNIILLSSIPNKNTEFRFELPVTLYLENN